MGIICQSESESFLMLVIFVCTYLTGHWKSIYWIASGGVFTPIPYISNFKLFSEFLIINLAITLNLFNDLGVKMASNAIHWFDWITPSLGII